MIATVVHTEELLRTVAAAVVSGLGVTFAFSVGIWGAGQFIELNRNERHLAAGAAGVVGILALLFVAAALFTAIVVMTHN